MDAATLTAWLPEALGAAASAAEPSAEGAGSGLPWWVSLIPLLPVLGVLWCAICAVTGLRTKAPAWGVVWLLAAGFGLTAAYYAFVYDGTPRRLELFEWIGLSWGDGPGESFRVGFSFMLDGLSLLWMLFVMGLAALIGLYASEYMSHDVGLGYCRFFAAFSLFVFSMACLVMGSNMLMLFLGWEGVGLCSYLLIGYFYKKPEAVAAGKKAFIVNRIGDLGLLMAVFLTFVAFGTLEHGELFALVEADTTAGGATLSESWLRWAIPLLLCLGAFGKSAQVFFYVWLPDAMEGPTPVSALIHAATMVTAGVYLVARFTPLFAADPDGIALTVVTWSGAITAFWAATIAMAQHDIKRIMGYSTISQLGYMFAGLGVLTSTGGVFHVLTHAFFKATLFLACGAVMHGFAGQLDMRRLSGMWSTPGFRVVAVAMLIGCLNLSGFPFTAGYFSKDLILAEAFYTPDAVIAGSSWAGWLLLLTAGLTAYYTFRVFFRVFVGEVHHEPGDEHHGDEHHGDEHHGEGHDDHAHAGDHGHEGGTHGGHGGFHPHPPGWAMNGVLAALSVLSIAAAGLYFVGGSHGWTGGMVHASTADISHLPWSHHGEKGETTEEAAIEAAATPVALAAPGSNDPHTAGDDHGDHGDHGGHADHAAPPLFAAAEAAGHTEPGTILGFDPHKVMYYVSAVVGAVGILAAAFFHGPVGVGGLLIGSRREPGAVRMDGVARMIGPFNRWAERKWYVDELYGFLIVGPLRVVSHVFAWVDALLVDGLVEAAGKAPRWLAGWIRPASQTGVLHDYALRMVGGVALVLLIAALVLR